MVLGKWATNSKEVLAAIPESEREIDSIEFTDDSFIKALGIQWNPQSDAFTFKGSDLQATTSLTKRQLLSKLSKVFDPIGFISCVTVTAKLLMQKLWCLKIDWDEEVPFDIKDSWNLYEEDLRLIPKINIPRLITKEDSRYEFHGFCDASEKAYGAIVYLKIITSDSKVSVHFITSKTKVAPIKAHSIARLELNAAYILTKLIKVVHDTLKIDGKIYCWTDSTITLSWIKSDPRRWHTYVCNRVAKIQELADLVSWNHVPGKENPADLASRGSTVKNLLREDLWWKGPTWLSDEEIPSLIEHQEASKIPEEKKVREVHHIDLNQGITAILSRFSSLIKLKRVTALILKWKANRLKPIKGTHSFSATELDDAFIFWIKFVQQDYFSDEIKKVKAKQPLSLSSPLKRLDPFLDNKGILRVGGRLENAVISYEKRHQIILPSQSHISRLIVDYHHLRTLHGGFQVTWTSIQSQYWIIGGRNLCRFFIRKCVTCRRYSAKAAEQIMGNLPSPRVAPSRPFLHSGVDYAGPFTLCNPVKTPGRSPKHYKGYLCLFVCLSTKAVHFELTSSLSTEAFLMAFRKFISRRGFCKAIYSDNGTNFVGAEKELKRIFKEKDFEKSFKDNFSDQNIEFHFNPPYAPHRGGLWESAVKSCKKHLRRVMGAAIPTYEEFEAILIQIEAVLNSRPLFRTIDDPNGNMALTPGHFLVGEPLISLPDDDLLDLPTNRCGRFQLQQHRVQHFWKRWSQEYLHTLQQRNKWYHEKGNLAINDVVLLMEDSPPARWKMGRVCELHLGSDDRVRSVTLQTEAGKFDRPIQKLVPLLSETI